VQLNVSHNEHFPHKKLFKWTKYVLKI